jgi:alpha-aminoadipic semialdehyde synthase
VSKGTQEVLQRLPVKWVSPSELKTIVSTVHGRDKTHCIYAAVAKEEHMVRKRDTAPGTPFNKVDYRLHPDAYEPVFHEDVIPYVKILVRAHSSV